MEQESLFGIITEGLDEVFTSPGGGSEGMFDSGRGWEKAKTLCWTGSTNMLQWRATSS